MRKIIRVIFAISLIFVIPGSAETIIVDTNGEMNYTSIQEAVNDAMPEDTIFIYPGSYFENINVNKELTITSLSGNPADTIVEAENTENNVFYVTANNVTINGLTIKGAIYDEYGDDKAGIWLNGVTGCQITENNLTNHIGVSLFNSNGNKITNNVVYKSRLYGMMLIESSHNELIDNIVTRGNQPGILLHMGCSNNTLVNNTVNLNYGGIELYYCNNNVLSNNNVSNSKSVYGFHIVGNNNKLNNNYAISDKEWGFRIVGNDNILENNFASLNTHAGFMISGNGNAAKNNTATSNEIGFVLYDAESCMLDNNNASYNNRYGIHVEQSSKNNTLNNNTVDLNLEGGILIDDPLNNSINGETKDSPFLSAFFTSVVLMLLFFVMNRKEK